MIVDDAPALRSVVIDIASSVFAAEAMKRAAYALMDRMTVAIEERADGFSLRIIPVQAAADLATIERDFRRELLDQDLRLSLEARTEPIRTAILGLAFSRTGLQDG